MISISHTGLMTESMHYSTETYVSGLINRSEITITRVHPNRMIELYSDTGAIHYRVLYNLVSLSDEETELICTVRFDLHGILMKVTGPVIESMARLRLENDLKSLREMMVSGRQSLPDKNASQSNPRR